MEANLLRSPDYFSAVTLKLFSFTVVLASFLSTSISDSSFYPSRYTHGYRCLYVPSLLGCLPSPTPALPLFLPAPGAPSV